MPAGEHAMPSPFPGMNPYLERQEEWDTFHPHFLVECVKRLVKQVAPQYQVRSGTRLYIHEPSAEERRLFAQADIGITYPHSSNSTGTTVATLTAPMYRTIPFSVETERVNYVEIRASKGNDVVTVIELLSRTNKIPRTDRDVFVQKRGEILRSSCHYVEINLLRAGRPMPFSPPIQGPFYVAISRANERDRVGTWEWGLHDPLPTIPIPLREPDRDVELDLKSILDTVYDDGGFARMIYDHPPEPALTAEDEGWAKSLVTTD